MKIVLVDDEGQVHDLVEHPEGYNLANPMARMGFMDELFKALERLYNPYVARESHEKVEIRS
jgi:hypothetical protein